MKNLSLTSLLLITVLVFTSCSVENDPILEDQLSLSSRDIFAKQPTVQRNADGSYFVDYKLKAGVGSDIAVDDDTNTKDINLYSSNSQTQKSFNEDLPLTSKGQFTVGINNTETNSRSTITIFDDDIKFSRNAKQDHLKGHGIQDNGDGTYTVDFTVKENIKVDFVKNEAKDRYEIHLDRGDSAESDFSRTFTKEPGENLEIVFVNYYYDASGRNNTVEKAEKPRSIINDGISASGY